MIISDQVRLVPSPADTVYDVRSAQLFSSRFLDLLQDSEVNDYWHHALPAANIFFFLPRQSIWNVQVCNLLKVFTIIWPVFLCD